MENEKKWEDYVEQHAKQFSRQMQDNFVGNLKAAEFHVPSVVRIDGTDNRVAMLETFLDVLVGTTVSIGVKYASTEEQFEKNMMALMHKWFEFYRDPKNQSRIIQ